MATPRDKRLKAAIVLVTLAFCAFFFAQGATALLGAKVLSGEPQAKPLRSRQAVATSSVQRRRDPSIILRRNIFDSALGDLTEAPIPETDLPLGDVAPGDVASECQGGLRLIGTVVLPGDFERSLAAIVGADNKAGLHYGGAEVEGSRIRAILSDSVVLQSKAGLCRLAMFQVEGAPASRPLPKPAVEKKKEKRKSRRSSLVDRNAGLTDAEMQEGIEKVSDTRFNLSRAMLNKVLDNAGKIIGIAAVAPKIENGESIGMEIQGVRPDTLLTKIGIQNGDVFESVNGQALNSPDAALGAYTTLRTADKFSLAIRRNGKPMVIDYNLQ
jgi:general secretion pathway protein C